MKKYLLLGIFVLTFKTSLSQSFFHIDYVNILYDLQENYFPFFSGIRFSYGSKKWEGNFSVIYAPTGREITASSFGFFVPMVIKRNVNLYKKLYLGVGIGKFIYINDERTVSFFTGSVELNYNFKRIRIFTGGYILPRQPLGFLFHSGVGYCIFCSDKE